MYHFMYFYFQPNKIYFGFFGGWGVGGLEFINNKIFEYFYLFDAIIYLNSVILQISDCVL